LVLFILYTTFVLVMDKYTEKLLSGWEETYKKGQLTFWLLLSIREERKYLDEIIEFVKKSTKGTISCEEQSVYRAFRKFYDAEIVDFEYREGNKGPDRKYYFLTPIGKELLEQFINRNMLIFYEPEIASKLRKTAKTK
jgi:PadR family transcriptional regulator, regulatory protein PadR